MVLHRAAGAVSTSSPCTIQAGDLVVVYERFDSMKAVYVNPGESYGNRYGNFKLKDWVGKPFGSRVESSGRGTTGWVYLLAPTPELWTVVLRHRTQILHLHFDKAKSVPSGLLPAVLESGTGSGSLTHSLARAVAPTGHVHTFEFHQPRAEAAAKEFKEHGMADVITTMQRNIEELGFPQELHGAADGVFLDLPGPWHAVASAAQCLRPDGVFCSFSPCIEQVQRTCAALEEQGFFAVRTLECLLRQYEVRQERFGALGDDLQGAQQLTGKRKRQENFQSRKRQTPAAPAGTSNHAASTEHITANLPEVAAALDAQLNQPVQQKADPAVNAVGASTPSSAAPSTMQSVAQQINLVTPSNQLQPQLQDVALPEPTADEINPTLTSITSPSPASQTDVQATRSSNGQGNVPGLQDSAQGSRQGQPRPQRYVVAKPVNDARGHTGYLTFARRSVDD